MRPKALAGLFPSEERVAAKRLLALAGPVMIGILFAVMLNVLDVWYVSLLGAEPLEAISFALPVMLGVSHACIGVGTGVTAVIGAKLGAKRHARAGRAARNAVLLALALGVVLAGTGLASLPFLFPALGAEPRHMPYLSGYMGIWYGACVPMTAFMMIAGSAVRGAEDTKTPAKNFAIVALLNGILNPLLIFGVGPLPGLGTTGSALATALALSYGCYRALRALRRTFPEFEPFSVPEWISDAGSFLHIGLPSFLAQLMPAAAQLYVTALLGATGAAYVAGYGVAVRLETLFLVFFMGLSVAVNIAVARGHGAESAEETALLRRVATKISLAAGAVFLPGLLAVGAFAVPFMAPDAEIAAVASAYLYRASLSLGPTGAAICASAMFNATKRPYRAFSIYALRCAVFLWPLCYLGMRVAGAEGIFWGVCAANVLAFLYAARLTARRFAYSPAA
jgi:putative MATE family efflux protein